MDEKIAIVGMAFRFPGGAESEESFWEILKEGREVIGEIGNERWSSASYFHPTRSEPGRSVTRAAGLLDDVDMFDASFFGISPREAGKLDPQQRLLLELTWEALENGGQVPGKLAGTDTAVYLGISGMDYAMRAMDDLSIVDGHSMTGNALSIAANRISYAFDLRGPSMALDTACSSSLVALHQACRSLRNGESSMAVTGGIHLLLHPYPFIGFSKASMLSATGQCRAFDVSGDGYVRSEGGAILFLKTLDRAQADGDPIHAVILATGTNSDGADKSGITIPSPRGQADLLRMTLEQAGLKAGDIDYIEAHGTGTAVGDPIEASAIGEVLGSARSPDSPLYLGSVKSNVGHLEPASGMAGLVKTVLCLKHRALPPTLNLESPNPRIDFKGLNLQPVTEYRALPEGGRPLCMGVNSFGFGGANAHVMLREYRQPEQERTENAGPEGVPPLFLSAKTTAALRELAARYSGLLSEVTAAADYYDMAFTAATRRQWLDVRLAVRGNDHREIAASLGRFAEGELPEQGMVEEALTPSPAPVAFVYSGNGSQWIGMGRQLMEEEPLFRRTVEEIEGLLGERVDFSLAQQLQADTAHSHMHLTEVAQPTLFAVQVGITRLLRRTGLQADHYAGHSVGEVAAAWAAGVLTLEQAVTVIHERSAAQALTRGGGRMAVAGMSPERLQEEISKAGLSGVLELAGINSPRAVILSGDLEDLEELGRRLEEEGAFFRLLDLEYAFHSSRMDSIRDRVQKGLADLEPRAGDGVFVSSVTGGELAGENLDATYWWDNIRQPVLFEQAIGTLIGKGCRLFLEIAPHAIMQRYVGECLTASGTDGRALPTLNKDGDTLPHLQKQVYRAWLLGAPWPQEALFPQPGRYVRLPTYPWQRERYWCENTSEGYGLIGRKPVHPLLGYRLKDGEALWENHLDIRKTPYLADHVVAGAVVLPGSAFAEMALAASAEHYAVDTHEIEGLEIRAALVLDPEHATTVRFDLSPEEGRFRIRARRRLSEDPWTLHVVGRLVGVPPAVMHEKQAAVEWDPDDRDGGEVIDRAIHYRRSSLSQLEYGPAFQGVVEIRRRDQELLARIQAPESIRADLPTHLLHPVFLDACFQTIVDVFREDIDSGKGVPLVPVRIGRLRLFKTGGLPVWCGTHVIRRSPHSILVRFRLLDETGDTIALVDGCRFQEVQLNHGWASLPSFWTNRLHVKPRTAAEESSPIAEISHLIDQAEALLLEMEPVLRSRDYFQQVAPLFDALVSAFAYRALIGMVERHEATLSEVVSGKLIDPRLRDYFSWLCRILVEDELLEYREEGWVLAEGGDPPTPEDIWLALLGDYPAYLPELVFAGRVGLHLVGLLEGDVDVDGFSASLKASPLLDQLYDASPTYLGMDLAAREIVRAVAADWPDNRRLRILEIAASSRAFPRQILTYLPPDRCDYVLGDTEDDSFAQRQLEFAGHPFISTVLLDWDSLTLGEDLPQYFDLVVVNYDLHRADDLHRALTDIRAKLAPGGKLLLLERHPARVMDFVDGLEEEWWRMDRAGEVKTRMLVPAAWKDLLTGVGFAEVETLLEPECGEREIGSYLLLATTPDTVVEMKPVSATAESWLLLADGKGDSRRLAESLLNQLLSHGHVARVSVPGGIDEQVDPGVIVADMESPDGMAALLNRVTEEMGGCDHVIHLLGLEAGGESAERDPIAAQERRCITLLYLLQALEGKAEVLRPKLWLITTGGGVFDHDYDLGKVQPSQAPLWGFGRVIMNEYANLGCRLIDLRTEQLDAGVTEALITELLASDGEEEVVLTERARYVPRMERRQPPVSGRGAEEAGNLVLGFDVPGQLKNLRWTPAPEQTLDPDAIEIQPQAAGLNFRDVMYALGLLPDDAVENGFSGATLGMELAGVVTRVGTDVTKFELGDAVVAFAPACFARRVMTKAASAVPKPSHWSFEEAATVPTVFFTAYYALHHLARLQPGEKVLIHGAAGGVGIAAIQLARYLGAEVFATAGSDEKRDFVRLLGADHVMSSRNLDFADEILHHTDGKGVDVVLNSLAGEAVRRNLQVLRPFGRFLELGKRDFYENTHIGLRPFKDNITYYGIDADQLMVEQPALAERIFHEVMDLFRENLLRPLPYRSFPVSQIGDAFRYMQQSRQIGKILVTFDDISEVAEMSPNPVADVTFASDATYLVTGGSDGFGRETARWLAEQGVGNLVLLSRRGGETPGAAELVGELGAKGINVLVKACDVTDRVRLARVLKEIQRDLPPLRGIFHAAMVLDDGIIRNLDRERFLEVLKPKIQGAWNLHLLTQDLPLEFFVLYSSVTTFIGNPGQANYVAANMYLEALADYRSSLGLAASSVSWGAIEDAGYLTRNQEVKESLQSRLGGKALTAGTALNQLGKILSTDAGGMAVTELDWQVLARFLPSSSSARFHILRRTAAGNGANVTRSEDVYTRIAGQTSEEALEIVADLVAEEVASVLRLPKERLDPRRSLFDLGMDSLMAVELMVGLDKRFGVSLPTMALAQGPTINRVAESLARLLVDGEPGNEDAEEQRLQDMVSSVASRHVEKLDEEELGAVVEDMKNLSAN